MERIIKAIFVCILSLGMFLPAYADTSAPTAVQKPDISNCVRTYSIAYDKLYYLTLAGLNEYNYKIREIQTKGGYIVFETGYRKFLASIVYVSSGKSILKITPYSNNYDFDINVPQNLFKYVETYQAEKF